MKVVTAHGEFPLVGYESNTIHYPIEFKPENGFAYVLQSGNEIGAIPMVRVHNWNDLPNYVKLHPKLVETRAKCPGFKKQ